MKITNVAKQPIVCSVDNTTTLLKSGESLEVKKFSTILFSHGISCYLKNEAAGSRMLKWLSFFDDPFKLRKDYHIVIDFKLYNQSCNSHQMIVDSLTEYIDVETGIYYEYFLVRCDGKSVSPNQILLPGVQELKSKFLNYYSKMIRWNVVWDVFIEPALLEVPGYLLLHWLLSIWFGAAAKLIVLSMIFLNVVIELMICIFKLKKSQKPNRFFDDKVIRENCYDQP